MSWLTEAFDFVLLFSVAVSKKKNTSPYRHLSNKDSFHCPDKILIYFLSKKKLRNTDKGH